MLSSLIVFLACFVNSRLGERGIPSLPFATSQTRGLFTLLMGDSVCLTRQPWESRLPSPAFLGLAIRPVLNNTRLELYSLLCLLQSSLFYDAIGYFSSFSCLIYQRIAVNTPKSTAISAEVLTLKKSGTVFWTLLGVWDVHIKGILTALL